MTSEICGLMAERRINKLNPPAYEELDRAIRRKCREAKEKWMSEKCKEIESYQDKHDTFNVHRKVKEMTDKTRKHHITTLRDANNEIILGKEAKLQR